MRDTKLLEKYHEIQQQNKKQNQLFKNSEFHTYNVYPEACKGICLSNYYLWKYAVDNNTNLVIFEDDVIITSPEWFNWEEMFKDNFDLHKSLKLHS